MESAQALANGFLIALQPHNLFLALIGISLGTLVGLMPGIGSAAAIAILLPLVFGADAVGAIIMLSAVYYGSSYSGAIVAILLRIPGEASTLMTCIDGHKLCQQGRARQAIVMSALASFVGGTLSVLGLMVAAVPLARYALRFGPPEYFSLIVLALALLVMGVFVDAQGAKRRRLILTGLISVMIGLALGTVGADPRGGNYRFIFGMDNFIDGVPFIVAAMGLFVLPELFSNLETAGQNVIVKMRRQEGFLPTRRDHQVAWPAIWRGSLIGFFIGILPGAGAMVASFAAYAAEKRRNPSEVGEGSMAGVAAPEAANNASTGGAMIPMFTLGIPGSASTAMMLAALVVLGLQPGPLLMRNNPDVFWGAVASMYIGNLAMLLVAMPVSTLLMAYIVRVAYAYLYPFIILLVFVGAYSLNLKVFDVVLFVAFGLAGYIMEKLEIPTMPLAVGLILGPLLESHLITSLTMSRGNPLIFFERPLSLALLATLLALVLIQFFRSKRRKNA